MKYMCTLCYGYTIYIEAFSFSLSHLVKRMNEQSLYTFSTLVIDWYLVGESGEIECSAGGCSKSPSH